MAFENSSCACAYNSGFLCCTASRTYTRAALWCAQAFARSVSAVAIISCVACSAAFQSSISSAYFSTASRHVLHLPSASLSAFLNEFRAEPVLPRESQVVASRKAFSDFGKSEQLQRRGSWARAPGFEKQSAARPSARATVRLHVGMGLPW